MTSRDIVGQAARKRHFMAKVWHGEWDGLTNSGKMRDLGMTGTTTQQEDGVVERLRAVS
jgi:hypothetical protein